MEDLETVNGGDKIENFQLAMILTLTGHGVFFRYVDGIIVEDVDGIEDFFESKGWTFIPSADGANLYVDNNGLRIPKDKVVTLLRERVL